MLPWRLRALPAAGLTGLVIAVCALALYPQAVGATPLQPATLPSGSTLTLGQSLASLSGAYRLIMQGDGNLVEYDTATGTAAWAASTDPSGAVVAMQGDGNLVVYDGSGKALWASNTPGNPGAYLSLPDTGQLAVLSAAGVPLWAATGEMVPNATLTQGHSITSPSGSYRLTMQGDGNLVEYTADGTPVWATGTDPTGSVAAMQADGNLVVYNAAKKALWASNTSTPGAYLSLLDTGQLAVISPAGIPLWAGPGELASNASMTRGESLSSPSGAYLLTMQGDGNLVEYSAAGTVMWAASTNPSGAHAVMQGDGNLVVYDGSGKPLWASNTPGSPGAYLSLLDSGQLSVNAAATGSPLWGPGLMPAGASLSSGQSLISPTGRYRLTLQSDGNLVEYTAGGTDTWSSSTGPSGAVAVMQGDGNFVVYDAASHALWSSQTSGKSGAYLLLSDDGQLSVLSVTGAATLWQPTPGPRPCTDTWTGATSAQWSDAANWGAGAPVPSDWVCIPANAANEPVQLTTSVSVDGVTNNGTLAVSGNLDLTDPSSPTSNVGTLNVSGQLTLGGLLWDAGPLNLQYGTLQGPGTLMVLSGAQMTIPSQDGATLANNVTVVVDGALAVQGNARLDVPSGTTVENYGTLSLADGSDLGYGCPYDSGGCGTVVNEAGATLSYPGTSGNTATVYANLTNAGTVSVTGGTLQLENTTTVTSTGSFTGSGTLEVYGGTLDLTASLTISQPVTVTGTLELESGVTATLPALTLEGGTVQGPGTLAVPSGGQLTVPASDAAWLANNVTVVVDGALAMQGNASLDVLSGTTVENYGTLSLANGSDLGYGCQYGPGECGTVVNEAGATLSYPGSSGQTAEVFADLNNAGVVSVGGGTLLLIDTTTVTSTGSFSGSGTLQDQGTLDLTASLTISQPVMVDNGTLELESGVTATLPALTLEGTVQGPGTLAVPSGGQLKVPANQGADLTGNVTVVVDGTLAVQGNAVLDMPSGTTVENYGTLSLGNGGSLGYYASGRVVNEAGATLSYPGSSGQTAEVFADLNNAGVVSVGGGTLLLIDTTTVTSTGSFSGSGTLQDQGTLDLTASLTISQPVMVDNGTLELGSSVTATLPSLTLQGEVELDGSGPGSFGEVVSSGSVTASNGYLYLNGGSAYTPVCGTTVTALQAGSVSGVFSSVSSSGSLPSGGTWQATGTSTTAGAYLSCPIPSVPAAQTYGQTGSAGFSGSGDSVDPSGSFAEPVDTATGAYSTTETDASLAGLGVAFNFTRAYTSADTYSGPLGPSWTDSLNIFLVPGSGQVALHSGDGQVTLYTQNPGGSYTGAPGAQSVLSSVSGGGWLLARHDQENLTFNSSGQLVSWTDRNGIGLTMSYNGSGQLATVRDYAGQTVTFSYNASGLLTQTSFPPSRTVTYAYDSGGQLTSVKDAAGGVTSYTYNSQGFLATVKDQNGHQVVANTYDSSGRVISQVNAVGKTATFSYDAATSTTTYTDPNGGAWQDVYDRNVLVERIDPTGGVTDYSYDADLNLTAQRDPNGKTTTMTYDVSGNMLSKTAPGPISTTQNWSYDSFNDVTAYTDAAGNTTSYSYDSRGDLTGQTLPGGATISYTRDPTTGVVTTSTDERGDTTNYGYDTAGNLVTVTSPLGEETTYSYDSAGRKTATVAPLGNVSGGNPAKYTTSYSYDALDRQLSVTDANGNTTSYTYDAVGNQLSVTDPGGNTTDDTYNSANELVTVTAPGGSTTKYSYDGDGNRVSVTDGTGHTTSYAYDADDRVVTVTDPLGAKTSYAYDADGNRMSVKDAVGVTTSYTYDALSRLVSVAYSGGTPGVSYSYTADGQQASMTDGTGTTTYGYDARGELTSVQAPGGTYTYGYDKAGDVASRDYPDGTSITYGYDADGRMTSLTVGGTTANYSYDADSELTSTSLPNGQVEARTYDPAGLITAIDDTVGSNAVTGVSYTYDAGGNPTSEVTAAGETDTYSYDSQNRLTAACYGTSCSSGSIAYTYDADGDRTSETTGSGSTTYSYNAADELTQASSGSGSVSYSYNPAGQMTAAGSTTYSYNAADELTQATSGLNTTTYTYDGDGLRATAASGGTTTTFGYDVNGAVPELVKESQGGSEVDSYVWAGGLVQSMGTGGADYYVAHDALGSTTALTSATGAVETLYTYDPFGAARTTTNVASTPPTMPLQFAGEYLDPTTGLYYLDARYLNPTLGAFTATDPLPEAAQQPATSPYLYANDQPTVLTDPTGNSLWNPTTWTSTVWKNVNTAVEAIPVVGDVVQGGEAVVSWGQTAGTCLTSFGSSKCSSSIAASTAQTALFGASVYLDTVTFGTGGRLLVTASSVFIQTLASNSGTASSLGYGGSIAPEK